MEEGRTKEVWHRMTPASDARNQTVCGLRLGTVLVTGADDYVTCPICTTSDKK